MSVSGKGGVGIRLYVAGGEVVRAAFNDVADSGKKMWAQIALGEKAANPAIVALSRASGEAQGAVQGLAGRIGGASNVLGAFGVAGVVAAAAMGGVMLAANKAREAMDFADQLQDTAATLGITTDRLQEYQYALRVTGGEAEAAASSIEQFREKFGAAKGEYGTRDIKPFKFAGFEQSDLDGFHNVQEALDATIAKIAAMGDESEQAAAAAKLGLTGMLPLIREGEGAFDRLAREAHRLGVVMDADLIQRAAEAKDEFDTMSQVIDIQLKTAFIDLGPTLVYLMGLVADLATDLADLVDSWRDLNEQSSRGIQRKVDDLKRDRTALDLQDMAGRPGMGPGRTLGEAVSRDVSRGDPRSIAIHNAEMKRLFDVEIAKLEAELGGRAPPAAPGNPKGTKPVSQLPTGGRGRGAGKQADTYTGKLPPGLLAAIADERLTEAEARRLFANVPESEDVTFVIINALGEPAKGETPEQISTRTAIDNAFAAPDQNPSLNSGPPALVRGPFGGLMSPEDKEDWARDIGDATADGIDAALHGDFWGWFKQQLYRNALEGLSDGIADALKSADFSGIGGGGFWGSLISGVGSTFGFGGRSGSSLAAHAGSSALVFAGGRAAGGPMGDGMWYRAGEHGQTELAMVGAGGHVANHDQTRRMLADMMDGVGGASGARAPVVNFTFAPVINAQGAGPREIDALKGELATMRREMPGEVVAVVSDAIARRQIG